MSAHVHLDRDGLLSVLRDAPFASDADLQALTFAHPSLLAGEPDRATDWFAIERVGLTPSGFAGADRWPVNHLFISGDGVPAIVEIRRAAAGGADGDPFGDLLLHAANAAAWWPLPELRAAFAESHAPGDIDPAVALARFIGSDRSQDAFWSQVRENLAAGRLRMVLVVDEPRPDLMRTVEFLSRQLRDSEIWMLELRQRTGASGRVLRADVRGRRQESSGASRKLAAGASAWPAPAAAARVQEAWVADLKAACDAEESEVLDHLVRWMGQQYGATFVTETPAPALDLSVKEAGRDHCPFGVTQSKTATIHLGALSASSAFEAEAARRALVEEIAKAGVAVGDVDLAGDLRISLKNLGPPKVRDKVLAALDGVIETLSLLEAPRGFAA